jgi:hypothetical protein
MGQYSFMFQLHNTTNNSRVDVVEIIRIELILVVCHTTVLPLY